MVDSVSTVGMQIACSNLLVGSQSELSKLASQLATGRYSDNLTDYNSSEAQKLLNFNKEVNVQNGFLDVISAILPRMTVYESTFTSMETTISETYTTLVGASVYTDSTNASVRNEIENALSQMEYYLNQQVGERYIFSGSRYNEAPVTDLTALSVLTVTDTPTIATGDEVAEYDIDYDPMNPTALVPEANTNETANIDTTKKLTYGVNSNEECFQKVIIGLRWALGATYDQANYETMMDTAQTYLNEALGEVRALHTDTTNAYSTLQKAEETINSKITSLESQVDTVEGVDVNEVTVKIQTLQAQMEASYSAVSEIINLSILDYL